MDIQLVYQHLDFIVVDKPCGVSTHASPGDNAPNVVDLLRPRFPSLHPLSRLDNGTSGLLLLALNAEASTNIEIVQKSYLAQVFGVAPAAGVIEKELVTKRFGTRVKKRQKAESSYRRLKHDAEGSCLLIHIETGRHHQIRKHLRSIGHPVIGDFRHGYKAKNLEYQEKLGTRLRMLLHCWRLLLLYQGTPFQVKLRPTK